ncbi:MAG: serine/threonine protein kinase [Deltaproteobacteria bacterium]|nr:serine/threonine protein kinase [Deltaproteobacteria bacterium]
MFVNEIATMTAVKVREVSTSTYTKIARGVQRISKINFINRNRRKVTVGLAIWLAANIAGYLTYHFTVTSTNDGFYKQGLAGAQDLASKSGPFVLEKDILSLNVAIKELKTVKDLKFAAIMDHQSNILAHSNADLMNRKFEPLQNEIPVDKVEGIAITAGFTPEKKKVFGFVKNIIFSEVEIGKAYLALSAESLSRELTRLRFIYLSGVFLTIILTVVVLVWLDRWAQAKALKFSRDIEKMDRIGPYHLHQRVARGGMAELYLADYIRQDGFRRKVAIKRILPHLAGNQNFIKMFTREARVAALLQHPNIVQIFDYGEIEKAYFIAMEFIEGKNLGEILSKVGHGLPVDQTVFIITQICKGLDYSHTKRDDSSGEPFHIVHRDISPQNMLISYQGEVKISDFGISKARSEPSLTQAGVVKGKLAYLSPEQALGESIDHQADIYALGLVFYETLTGKRVYQFSSDVEAIRSIPKLPIAPLKKLLPQISEKLDRIVMKCLEKKKDLRYQQVSDLYTDLVAFKKEFRITFDTSDLVNFMKKFRDSEKAAPKK